MPNVTLVMTRQPLAEFLWMRGRDEHYEEIEDEEERTTLFGVKDARTGNRIGAARQVRGVLSGQWGAMVVVEGPLVVSASRAPTLGDTIDAIGTLADTPGQQTASLRRETITLAGREVTLFATGGPITRTTAFDTMERYRTDSDKNKWHVRLPPRPDKVYPLVTYNAETVRKFHIKLGIRARNPGMCLRVLDHTVKEPGTNNMAGILLHEATNIGWLTGCIAPRTEGHRLLSSEIRHCVDALDTIYAAMGGFGANKRAALLIID